MPTVIQIYTKNRTPLTTPEAISMLNGFIYTNCNCLFTFLQHAEHAPGCPWLRGLQKQRSRQLAVWKMILSMSEVSSEDLESLTPQPDWLPCHRAQTSWQFALASVVSSSLARRLLCSSLLQRRSPAAWPRLTFLLSRELLRWSAGLRSRIISFSFSCFISWKITWMGLLQCPNQMSSNKADH